MASPLLADDQVMEAGQHTFYIDEQFFLRNESLNITQIRIDFGDGQGEWVVNNPFAIGPQRSMQPMGVIGSILKNITKTFVGRIIVVGIDVLGRTIEYGSPFKVLVKKNKPYEPLTACKGLQKWVINADASRLAVINAQYPNTLLDYKGRKDTAYFYFAGNGSSCDTNVLRKPIVFIDGFDPMNDRGVQKIYEGYINAFVDRATQNIQFGDYMLNQGYDFVILDFKHGNDLLERNAMTLVKLLQQLYDTYGSTFEQEITLIGPSMGSLIAQYALAYMEHNGIPHYVKTYISFDGCHQGANVPIGLQNFVEYITKRGVLKKMDLVRNGLYNGPAARQMLAHHVSAGSQSPAPDALRVKFLQNLAAIGEYPTQCRKVAIINGANNGTLNSAQTPDSDMLNISLKRKGWKSIWGLCDANICKIFNWVARTAPSSGTIKVAEMWTASPLFNLLFWVPPGKTNYYGSAAWNNSALDNAPGGLFGPVFASSGDESDYIFLAKEALYLITGSNRFSFVNHIDNFTMMPSYSAADLRFPNKNLYMNWKNEYLCSKTPFDFVYAPGENQQHVYVSQDNSEWFEAEIKCAKQDLPVLFNPTINGNSTVCTSAIFSVDFCKSNNRTVNWQVSNPVLASITGSGDQIALTKTGNGTVTLTATISYPCTVDAVNNPFVLTKTVYLGLPHLTQDAGATYYFPIPDDLGDPNPIAPVNQICTGQQISMKMNVARASGVTWSRTSALPSNTTWSQSGNTLNFYFWGNNQKATFKVSASNSCGTVHESFAFNSMSCGGDPGDPDPCNRFVVSPNPANGNINVYVPNIPPPCDPPIVIEATKNSTSRGITQVKLFDNLGNLKKQKTMSKSKQTYLNISGITPGIYYLEISDNAYKERQIVVVQ